MYFDYMAPLPQHLKLMLANKTATLLDVATDDNCVRLLTSQNSQIVEFLENHASEVFDAALDYSNPDLSNACFNLISIDNKRLIAAITRLSYLNDKAMELLNDESTDPVFINRLALITQLCVLSTPPCLRSTLLYFPAFLNFLYHRSVYDLFTSLLENDNDEAQSAQRILSAQNFPNDVIEFVKTLPDELSPDQLQNAATLYNVIALMVACQEFEPAIKCPTSLSILIRTFANPSTKLLNAQWEAVFKTYTPDSIEFISSNVNRLVELFSIVHNGRIYPYQISIMRLFGLAASDNLEFAKNLASTSFGTSLAENLSSFPKHTFFHRGIEMFIETIMAVPDLLDPILENIMPIVHTGLVECEVEMRAFAWNLIDTLKKADKALQLSDDTNSAFEEVGETIHHPYSDEKPQQSDEPDISNISPDQLIALLQMLAQGHR